MNNLNENGSARENLICGFYACEIVPYNSDVAYAKLPQENAITSSKALDQSVLETLKSMWRVDGSNTNAAVRNSNTKINVESVSMIDDGSETSLIEEKETESESSASETSSNTEETSSNIDINMNDKPSIYHVKADYHN